MIIFGDRALPVVMRVRSDHSDGTLLNMTGVLKSRGDGDADTEQRYMRREQGDRPQAKERVSWSTEETKFLAS